MSKHPDCNRCARPVADNAYLCTSCGQHLEKQLAEIPTLIHDIEVTYTRGSTSENVGARSASTALPWSENASVAIADLRAVLTVWARLIHDESHSKRAQQLPRADERHPDGEASIIISRWLLWHVEFLRHHHAGPQALADIGDAIGEVNHAMDIAAERRYLGPCWSEYRHGDCECPCHRGRGCELDDACFDRHVAGDDEPDLEPDACCLVELYAPRDVDVFVCRSCKTPHNVEKRQSWLLKRSEDQLGNAEFVGRALAGLGSAVTPVMIRGYAARGRLAAHGKDVKGRDLYRVGDVSALVHQIAVETERKAVAREAKRVKRSALQASA